MSNIKFDVFFDDGAHRDLLRAGDPPSEMARLIFGDDTGPSVRNLIIEIVTDSGKTVRVAIPNDSSRVIIDIDGERI